MRGRDAHEDVRNVNRNRVWPRLMIDTLSLLLAHFLLTVVAFKMFIHPDLNEEPVRSGRHFKNILPKKQQPPRRAGVESGGDGPGFDRA